MINSYKKITTTDIGLAYTILTTDDVISIDNKVYGNVYVILPFASSCIGKVITIKLFNNTSLDVAIYTSGDLIETQTGIFNTIDYLSVSSGIYRHSWISNGVNWEMVS